MSDDSIALPASASATIPQPGTIMSQSAFDKLLAKAADLGQRADETFQVAALAVARRALNEGPERAAGWANKLYLALNKGSRREAMTLWLVTYAGMVPNTDNATKGVQPFRGKKRDVTFDMEGAAEHPWFTLSPSKNPDETAIDLLKLVQSIINRVEKNEDADNPREVKHGELIAKLKALTE